MRPYVIRAIRTYLQAFVGLILASWGGEVVGWQTGLTVLQVAAVGAIPAVLALIQNWLEDSGTINLGPKG